MLIGEYFLIKQMQYPLFLFLQSYYQRGLNAELKKVHMILEHISRILVHDLTPNIFLIYFYLLYIKEVQIILFANLLLFHFQFVYQFFTLGDFHKEFYIFPSSYLITLLLKELLLLHYWFHFFQDLKNLMFYQPF